MSTEIGRHELTIEVEGQFYYGHRLVVAGAGRKLQSVWLDGRSRIDNRAYQRGEDDEMLRRAQQMLAELLDG